MLICCKSHTLLVSNVCPRLKLVSQGWWLVAFSCQQMKSNRLDVGIRKGGIVKRGTDQGDKVLKGR